MLFRSLASRANVIKRNFMKTAIRRDEHHDMGGEPGKNLPFDIHNRYKLTLYFILFFGSAMAMPFIAVRHQLTK